MRRNVIQHFREISHQTQPALPLLTRKLVAEAEACSLNMPPVEFLTDELSYPDAGAARGLS